MVGFRLATQVAFMLGVLAALGATPREAQAELCRELGLAAGCVQPKDVKNKAVRAIHRKDEAGAEFVATPDMPMTISLAPKVYATVRIEAPTAGTIIVNADLVIQALENPGPGTGPGVKNGSGSVDCALTNGGSFIDVNNRSRFFGSVDFDDEIPFETMSITRGFSTNRRGVITYALSCRVLSGTASAAEIALLRVRAPSISAQYYANINR